MDNPHMAGPVLRYGAPLADARAVVVLLHGRDQGPDDMRHQVVEPLDAPGVCYLAPTAADGSWFPTRFMAPRADNEPRLSQALACVGTLCVPRSVPQLVMGFSQGACLGCELVFRRPDHIDALVAFTGGLIGPPGTEWEQAQPLDRMPILLGGAGDDPWVPARRMRETAAVFRRRRADVRFELYADLGHEIGNKQIALARALIDELT